MIAGGGTQVFVAEEMQSVPNSAHEQFLNGMITNVLPSNFELFYKIETASAYENIRPKEGLIERIQSPFIGGLKEVEQWGCTIGNL